MLTISGERLRSPDLLVDQRTLAQPKLIDDPLQGFKTAEINGLPHFRAHDLQRFGHRHRPTVRPFGGDRIKDVGGGDDPGFQRNGLPGDSPRIAFAIQALDIIMQTKGLDMRKNGSVVLIAPREELALKEKQQLESQIQISDLEPILSESFQLNYMKAQDLLNLITSNRQSEKPASETLVN